MNYFSFIKNLLLMFVFSFIQINEAINHTTILHAPKEKPLGAWGPWELCKTGEFVRGVRLKSQSPEDIDDFGISGIELYCGKIGDGIEIPKIRSSVAKEGEWAENPYFCEGYFEGFQLKIDTIADGDDYAGITNIRLFCSGGVGHFSPETESAFGTWTEPKICQKGHVLCGIRTMIKQSKKFKINNEREDLVGINSLKMQCCPVTEPDCFPYDTWELIFEVDNSLAYEPLKYKYTKKVGMERIERTKDTKSGSIIGHGHQRYVIQNKLKNSGTTAIPNLLTTSTPNSTNENSNPRPPTFLNSKIFEENHDVKEEKGPKLFESEFDTKSRKFYNRNKNGELIYLFLTQRLRLSKETGFNWEVASSETWAPVRSSIVEITVAPGHYVACYQVVGICGDFFYRPEKFYQNGTFYDPDEKRRKSASTEWKKLARLSRVVKSFASMYHEGLRVMKNFAYILGYKESI